MYLPPELINKILLYNSHPVADLLRPYFYALPWAMEKYHYSYKRIYPYWEEATISYFILTWFAILKRRAHNIPLLKMFRN